MTSARGLDAPAASALWIDAPIKAVAQLFAADRATLSIMPGYRPSRYRPNRPVSGHRNLHVQLATELLVSRNANPGQLSSAISTRPLAGAFGPRNRASANFLRIAVIPGGQQGAQIAVNAPTADDRQ
jgi:hypothetical protein